VQVFAGLYAVHVAQPAIAKDLTELKMLSPTKKNHLVVFHWSTNSLGTADVQVFDLGMLQLLFRPW